MTSTKIFAGAAAFAALVALSPLAAQADVTLANPHDGGSIGPIGNEGIVPVLGEVFTPPVTGTLDSFTITFVGPVQQFVVGIGEWSGGPPTYTEGFGPTAIDYQSPVETVPGPQDFTFDPDVAVNAGSQYVFYISTDGLTNPADSANGLLLSQTPTAGFNYIVFNSSNQANSPWDYNVNYGADLAITAHISTPNPCNVDHPQACGPAGGVPEPGVWALMILGFGAAGAALRRQRARSALGHGVA